MPTETCGLKQATHPFVYSIQLVIPVSYLIKGKTIQLSRAFRLLYQLATRVNVKHELTSETMTHGN